MHLLIILLPLASVLQQSLGTEKSIKELTAKDKKEILDKHNAIRRAVKPTASNMLKMEWSEKARATAEKWAVKCNANISPLKERVVDGQQCGENLVQSSFSWSWPQAINVWVQAKSNFQYGVGALDLTEGIDIYTQLIWYNSYNVGCAVANCPVDDIPVFLYVCHYCPVGNKVSQQKEPYKSGPPCGDCPKSCEDKLCTNSCKYVNKRQDCDKLVRMFEKVNGKCEKWLQEQCEASCKCTNKII